jgi:vacuolar-type H+-ATPase subunit E/Vma4
MIVKHIKTGNLYKVLNDDIINSTNAQDGQKMVLYSNEKNMMFVRELKEFWEKFEIFTSIGGL